MDEFVWKEIFSIGVDEIDKQHQALLKLLNRCIQEAEKVKKKATLGSDDFNAINDLISELAAYTDTHFKTEEQLMRSINYPEFENHQNKHRILTEQVVHLEKNVINKETSAITSIITLLKDWYVEHILDEDKRIGAYIQSSKE